MTDAHSADRLRALEEALDQAGADIDALAQSIVDGGGGKTTGHYR